MSSEKGCRIVNELSFFILVPGFEVLNKFLDIRVELLFQLFILFVLGDAERLVKEKLMVIQAVSEVVGHA